MRIIYDRKTGDIRGIVAGRVTSHIPPSSIGDNTDSIDIDYDDKALKTSKLARLLDRERSNLLKKILVLPKDRSKLRPRDIKFKDKKEIVRKRWTVMVDTIHPKFHKDVKTYYKKAKKMGTMSEIKLTGKLLKVRILSPKGNLVGTALFRRTRPCCFIYEAGEVLDRAYFPHYVALYDTIKYLRGMLIDKLDMGGMVWDDDDLNQFKRKWGREINRPPAV